MLGKSHCSSLRIIITLRSVIPAILYYRVLVTFTQIVNEDESVTNQDFQHPVLSPHPRDSTIPFYVNTASCICLRILVIEVLLRMGYFYRRAHKCVRKWFYESLAI
jgi:hypothetical protein